MKTLIDVVIVEDDPMVLELHRQFVNHTKGFRLVGCAQDGREGLKVVSDLKPQLVILDVYMPESDGIEVLKTIRSMGINTDVILVTAAHNSEIIQLGMQYGAADYIIKPFTFQRFKKAMSDYLKFITKIQGNDKLTQADIDRLKGKSASKPMSKSTLPKGLDKTTLLKIVSIVRRWSGQFTVADVSQAMGVSCVTARRYLNFLHGKGWLKAVLSYGPVGRPVHKYSTNGDIPV